jgi:pimeloyl-ACP methyl ester carboxylesterase
VAHAAKLVHLAPLAIAALAACVHAPAPAPAFPARVALPALTGTLCGYDLGAPGGTTFVFLHGGPAYRSADFVRTLAPLLARRGRVVAFDQRGAGCSARGGPDLSVNEQVEDVAVLIRGLKAGPVVLIGHSYGGLLAAHVAVAHPELLARLVLLDALLDLDHALGVLLDRCAEAATAQGRSADADALRTAKGQADLLAQIGAIGAHGAGCTRELLVPPGHRPSQEDVERADAQDGYSPEELRNDGQLFQAAFTSWPGRLRLAPGALQATRLPIRAIWGADDLYRADPPSSALPTVLIPGAGHHSYREQPELVARAILEE